MFKSNNGYKIRAEDILESSFTERKIYLSQE